MKSYRVVVADDDALSRYLISFAAADAGHDVVGEAKDGRELVALCRSERPDLIISDAFMPHLGGAEAVRRLYSLGFELAVIFATAEPRPRLWTEFPHAVFLPKPLLPPQLREAIPAAMNRFERRWGRSRPAA